MLENVEVLYHSSIKIKDNKIIYIDPFKIDKDYNDADIVFITHDHFDHYSEEDIDKVINEIQPKIAVPIHYGSVVGTKQDATDFIKLLHSSIKGIILMKQ